MTFRGAANVPPVPEGFSPGGRSVVHGNLRRTDPAPDRRLAADCRREEPAAPGANRVREDPGGFFKGNRPPLPGDGEGGVPSLWRGAGFVCLPPQGVEQ